MNSFSCLCCVKSLPKSGTKICPECGHEFQGNGWDGIDAHWRSRHETVIPYNEFWDGLCASHRGHHNYDKAAMLHFRDEIRNARIRAFEDAENFHEVVVALESLGAFCLGSRKNGFNDYERPLRDLASDSALFEAAPAECSLHLSFTDLFGILRDGRNDAVHEGVYARNLA